MRFKIEMNFSTLCSNVRWDKKIWVTQNYAGLLLPCRRREVLFELFKQKVRKGLYWRAMRSHHYYAFSLTAQNLSWSPYLVLQYLHLTSRLGLVPIVCKGLSWETVQSIQGGISQGAFNQCTRSQNEALTLQRELWVPPTTEQRGHHRIRPHLCCRPLEAWGRGDWICCILTSVLGI